MRWIRHIELTDAPASLPRLTLRFIHTNVNANLAFWGEA